MNSESTIHMFQDENIIGKGDNIHGEI